VDAKKKVPVQLADLRTKY